MVVLRDTGSRPVVQASTCLLLQKLPSWLFFWDPTLARSGRLPLFSKEKWPVCWANVTWTVPVITHYAITVNPHIEAFNPFGKYLLKSYKIIILAKYAKTGVSTVENMINISAQCYSFWSWHSRDNYNHKIYPVRKKYWTLLILQNFRCLESCHWQKLHTE